MGPIQNAGERGTGWLSIRLRFKAPTTSKLKWVREGAEGPSIFEALSEQLGLKLEPKKAAMELVVIEHVDRPTEN